MPQGLQSADIGLVGLAVMGQNIVLNMADHGFHVAVFNRTTTTTDAFVAQHPPGSFGQLGGAVTGYAHLHDFVNAIKPPRRIIILVKAGKPTDAVIDSLIPLLQEGDVIIDGGNAHWEDTIRRQRTLRAHAILFVGSGVSGGEEGARFGPSLMPGGDPDAWKIIQPVWNAIAAKVNADTGRPLEGAAPGKPVAGGAPCAAWIGPDGAGHYVKMVHNGIEYADMQMICEAYQLLRTGADLQPEHIGATFAQWNTGELDSYLVEITADILKQRDPRTGKPFIDVVLDTAGQKGTGKWTSINALDMGVPAATVAEAVFARCMSAVKDERTAAADILIGPDGRANEIVRRFFDTTERFIEAVGKALYCSKICSYAQGFQLMAATSREADWNLNYGEIAMIWRGGCIIRARFLQKIKEAYDRDRNLANLLLDPYFRQAIDTSQADWRRVVSAAALAGIPIPAFSSALAYYDAYRSAVLPANLLQAQRDYFGAHTYERIDQPRGHHFHLDWPAPERREIQV